MPRCVRIISLCAFAAVALLICMSGNATGQNNGKKGQTAKPKPLTKAQIAALQKQQQVQLALLNEALKKQRKLLHDNKSSSPTGKDSSGKGTPAGPSAKGNQATPLALGSGNKKTVAPSPLAQLHNQQSALLRYAYVLLSASNPSAYAGYRSAAIVNVGSALASVDPAGINTANSEVTAMNKMPWRQIMRARGAAEFDAVSNAQIYQARLLILQAANMADAKTQSGYANALNRASADALAALQLNVAVAAKVSEIQMLTQAYVLVSATDGTIYRTHRAAAKRQLQVALNKLNGIPLAVGSVQQQIQTVTAANRDMLATLKDAALNTESVRLSNYQMMVADSLIQNALLYLNGIGDPASNNVMAAHGEIIAALLGV